MAWQSGSRIRAAAWLGAAWVVLSFPNGTTRAQGAADTFWAYQPVRAVAAPAVSAGSWIRTPIDQFVLARLETAQLSPAPDADRTTLVRRVYYDLIGLPPTPEEIDAFLRDGSEEALPRLVDELMARPQFGERWGRHWLDVARFGESVTLRGLIFKEAWRYRDYVIDAFNRDLPYDQFVQQQVAGDLMGGDSVEERQHRLIATTFLMLGNWNLEEQDKKQLRMDVVDEQLDTIGKAFLAQTLGCARCHDHKFDPIPTRDYYALAGILRSCRTLVDANVSGWVEVPLPLEGAEEKIFLQHEARLAALEARLKEAKAEVSKLAGAKPREGKPGRLAVEAIPGLVIDDNQAREVGSWRRSQSVAPYIGDGYLEDHNEGKGSKTLTFQPDNLAAGRYEVRLAYTHGNNRAKTVPVTILSAEGETTVEVDQQRPPPIDGHFVSLGQYRFEQNGQGFVLVATTGTRGHVIADAVQFLPVEAAAAEVNLTAASSSGDQAVALVKRLEKEVKEVRASGPKRPMAMSVREEEIGDTQVHRRGSVHTLGEEVPRGFWTMLGKGDSILPGESGRRQLAAWLASRQNPLIARVMVNRVWHWLLGEGLVRSVDNFGTTGERPSHPELLDHLATRFMDENWSVKRLVRHIMLSRVYQLSSDPTPVGLAVDPENRLWWKAHRRRLDAEALRDTMLAVSGELNLEQGGPTLQKDAVADYGHRFDDPRRSVYVPALRNSLPELFLLFDFADPSRVTGVRTSSTVAPQALYLMNNPFVMDRARHAGHQAKQWFGLGFRQRVDQVFLQTLGRPPTQSERQLAEGFLKGDESGADRWAELYQALFASVDFRYLN